MLSWLGHIAIGVMFLLLAWWAHSLAEYVISLVCYAASAYAFGYALWLSVTALKRVL